MLTEGWVVRRQPELYAPPGEAWAAKGYPAPFPPPRVAHMQNLEVGK
jgi:hypothetical protein